MKYAYRNLCNWFFDITKSLINWCIDTKRWAWAAKLVGVRTKLAEKSLHKVYPIYTTASTSDLMVIIAEKTDDPIVLQNMEITASNAANKLKRLHKNVMA